MISYKIRLAKPSDAAGLLNIYRPYVERTAVSFEYGVPSADEFRSRIEYTLGEYPYLAAVSDGAVIGYAYASQFHPRPAYKHCAEPSIYIDDNFHGMGVGRALYGQLESILIRQNVFTLCSCVAVTDGSADPYLTNDSEAFHRKMGYGTVGRHTGCGYKFGRWYSVVWMEKHLCEKPEHPDPFIPFPELECTAGLWDNT